MRIPIFFPALALVLLGGRAAQAQDVGPRQLGAPPTMPPPARPRTAPAPRQLDAVPVAPPDTTRRATVTTPLPGPMSAPAPVYAPTPPGRLPGNNTRAARFQVGLKNGLVYNASDVETKTPLFGRSYLLLDGQRKFDLNEVGFYEDETGHYVRTTLPGSSRESTLRRDKTGRISLYSITTSQYSSGPGGFGYPGYGGYGYGGYGMGGMGYPYNGYRTVKTEYFSKDNGPIQSLSTRNLMLATSDNAGAQQLLMESRRYQQITVGSYVVGGGLLIAGLLQSLQPTDNGRSISPMVYAAIPVLIVPIVLQSKQASNQRQAIALYNAGK
ncbi:hypothetical protein AUC43_00375 [Hymenobacter sedentarius]|uniref:Uncharacterized protein n=1 Tax=Hymenobacter sedentarius TaxID=1411621 RepID=A0A0U4A654_9BACT|nr:hypothetical protein [Hymenobacter sedentarius]ALW83692.1 hypothetical protein AUC43_00375 [Hymenobacter sedentarius]